MKVLPYLFTGKDGLEFVPVKSVQISVLEAAYEWGVSRATARKRLEIGKFETRKGFKTVKAFENNFKRVKFLLYTISEDFFNTYKRNPKELTKRKTEPVYHLTRTGNLCVCGRHNPELSKSDIAEFLALSVSKSCDKCRKALEER